MAQLPYNARSGSVAVAIVADIHESPNGTAPVFGWASVADRMAINYYADRSRKVLIVTGLRMGIYKILTRDKRLMAVTHVTSIAERNVLTLPFSEQFPYHFQHAALQTRYRVIVPRIVVDTSSTRLKAMWT